jgi:hypothetical protein
LCLFGGLVVVGSWLARARHDFCVAWRSRTRLFGDCTVGSETLTWTGHVFLALGTGRHINVPIKTHPIVVGPWPYDIIVPPTVVQKSRRAGCEQKCSRKKDRKNYPDIKFHFKLGAEFIFTDPSIAYIFHT